MQQQQYLQNVNGQMKRINPSQSKTTPQIVMQRQSVYKASPLMQQSSHQMQQGHLLNGSCNRNTNNIQQSQVYPRQPVYQQQCSFNQQSQYQSQPQRTQIIQNSSIGRSPLSSSRVVQQQQQNQNGHVINASRVLVNQQPNQSRTVIMPQPQIINNSNTSSVMNASRTISQMVSPQRNISQMMSPQRIISTPSRQQEMIQTMPANGSFLHQQQHQQQPSHYNTTHNHQKVMTQQEFLLYKAQHEQHQQLQQSSPSTGNVFQGNSIPQTRNNKQVSDLEQEQKIVQNQIDKLLQRSQNISANYQKSIQQSQAQLSQSKKQSHKQYKKSCSSTEELNNNDELVEQYQEEYLKDKKGQQNNQSVELQNDDPIVQSYFQEHISKHKDQNSNQSVELDHNDPLVQSYIPDYVNQLNESLMDSNVMNMKGHTGTLQVTLVKATNLPSSIFDKTDGYVKVNLNQDIQSTQVINDQPNPTWDSTLSFPLHKMGPSQFLKLEVFDKDTISDDLLGTATLPLYNLIQQPNSLFDDSLALLDKNEKLINAQIFLKVTFTPERK